MAEQDEEFPFLEQMTLQEPDTSNRSQVSHPSTPITARTTRGFPFLKWYMIVGIVAILIITGAGIIFLFEKPDVAILNVTIFKWALFIDICIMALYISNLCSKAVMFFLSHVLHLDIAVYLVAGVQTGTKVVVWAVIFNIAWLPLLNGIETGHRITDLMSDVVHVVIFVSIARILKNFAVKFVSGRVMTRNLLASIRKAIVMERICLKLRSPRETDNTIPGVRQIRKLAENAQRTGFTSLFEEEDASKDESTLRSQVRALALKIYHNCVGIQDRLVTRADVARLIDSADHLTEAFRLFEMDKHEGLTLDQLVKCVYRIVVEREKLSNMIKDQTQIGGVVDQIINFLFWMLMVIISMLWVGVDIVSLLVPVGSLFLALSFALGDTIKGIFESLVMIFIESPFGIGDEIQIESNPSILSVERIRLTSTTFRKLGKVNACLLLDPETWWMQSEHATGNHPTRHLTNVSFCLIFLYGSNRGGSCLCAQL
mmetsp:Transcript_38896/g.63006  ORF Transcript_38896/g.63006 Transcript_38896/m.63006 type:complete len:485 (-) Transcript_38896:615-2069(-)